MSVGATVDTFVLLAALSIEPGCGDEGLALVDAVHDRRHHEPTVVNTILHRAADDTGLSTIYGTWRDRDCVSAVQMHRPYRAEYEGGLPARLRVPRAMVFEASRADHAEGAAR